MAACAICASALHGGKRLPPWWPCGGPGDTRIAARDHDDVTTYRLRLLTTKSVCAGELPSLRSLRASSGDILKAERGVASCGGGSCRLPRAGRVSRPPATLAGREGAR